MVKDSGKAKYINVALMFMGRYGTLICLLFMILFFGILLPQFRSSINITNLMGQVSVLAVFAAGMTCCLKMGDFDLSLGAVSAVTSIAVAKMLLAGYSIVSAITFGILIGFLAGLMNGFLVAYVNLPAFVTTLANMGIFLGAAMVITQGKSLWSLPKAFSFIGRGDVVGIPIRFLIMITLLIVIWFFHKYTTTGRRMEAIGGNPEASRLSGINVAFNRLLGYVLNGVCASIAGIILTSSLLGANPMQGTHYLLDSFAACFIGAATVRIGQFHIWGTFVGVLIIGVAVNGLIMFQVPGYYTEIIKGGILLLAVFLSTLGYKFIKD